MRALHKAVRRVYSASPWGAENTMHTVYAIAHHQPFAHSAVIKRLVHWLNKNAEWEGTKYTDHVMPTLFQPEGYSAVWCTDMQLLQTLMAGSYSTSSSASLYLFVCVRLGGCT